ncbi:MAG: RNA polymerase sigma factor [Crocinitomicaceae bacterium]|nr:RNA polymerase sigma factor [Crocinitomicaceae bacterium]
MKKSKQEQFLELYEPIHDRFERFCRAKVYGMDSSDLINETLLVAFEQFDSLRSKKAFLSFLFGISIRVLSNHHRKRKERTLMKEDKILQLNDANANTELDADVYFLYKALDELSETQRECIILFEISGFKIREIAEIQNSSESAIKLRLKRGRARLLEIMSYESPAVRKEERYG